MKLENPKNRKKSLSTFFLFLKEQLRNDCFLIWKKSEQIRTFQE